ncbi:MAG TPA: PP2C family serine/threonine-protein phosphatase [Candidatus Methylacidiphilales bacterium]|jgi:serine/threonine protein phosphatase PrpC|nr:PP2C family serine/threonine-protein phosphatase [Candidatus Methylacidiphilales bacterium]
MVKSLRWTALSASVQGASHKRGGQGNQDAILLKNPSDADDMLLLAVADGHGSARSFRSERGSALAAECALRELRRFVHRLGPGVPLSRVRNQAKTRWPKTLIAAWKSAVRADLALRPFTLLEFAAFPESPPVLQPGRDLPITAYLAYGATLLAVAITPRYILYSQLGDGDILTVRPDGVVSRPLPRRHEFMANQTVSLCSHHAPDEFQIRVDPLRAIPPALIMLSTDGYANCFGDDEDFFQVAADFFSYLRSEGPAFVGEKLEDWLRESSHDGSGDDITVGLAVRAAAFPSSPRSA